LFALKFQNICHRLLLRKGLIYFRLIKKQRSKIASFTFSYKKNTLFVNIYSMALKIKLSIILFIFTLSSCTMSRVNSKINKLPTESFVKILNSTQILSCTDPKDKKCPIGLFVYSGSGMAIKLIDSEMIVLTAGHICDSRPSSAIKNSYQSLTVQDHRGIIHQAWTVSISHNSLKGDADLCLLWVPTLNVPKVNISLKPPHVGEELIYIGAPSGVYHPPTVPIFKGIYSGVIDPSSALITAPAFGGASGSAVLNRNNQIVGIIWGTNERFHHLSVMTNYEAFILFLYNSVKNVNFKTQ